jgi:tetratricopeptide (TPR) repeat protein
MKHVPVVMLAICLFLVMGFIGYFSYNLFLNSNTQILFTAPEPPVVSSSEVSEELDSGRVLTPTEIWIQKVRIETTPEINNLDELIAKYESALRDYPNNVEILYALGYYNFMADKVIEGKRYFDEALRIDSTNKAAGLGKAYIFTYINEHKLANEVFNDLEARLPEDIEILITRAEYYRYTGDKKLAEDYYRKALKQDPSNIEIKRSITELVK